MSKMVEELTNKGFKCIQYNGSHKKASWLCPVGHAFEKRAIFIINVIKNGGSGCPVCFDIRNRSKSTGQDSGQKTAKDRAVETIKKSGYKLLDDYKNSTSKLKMICPNDHECEISWHNFSNGTRCVHCKFEKQSKNTRRIVHNKIENIAIDQGLTLITPNDEYMGKNSRIQFLRNSDQSVFDTTYHNIITNNYRIDGNKYKNPNRLTKEEVESRLKDKGLILISEKYNNTIEKLHVKCIDRGHEFYRNLGAIKSCPLCNIPSTERKWISFFQERNIRFVLHDREKIGKELDIFLPDHNIAIECCGLYFHSQNDKLYGKVVSKYQHFEKRKLCEENGIRLFTIYDNENESTVWDSIIENAIGLSKKIFARKCLIKVVNTKESKAFLDENHMMGYSTAKNFGLYYEEELVALFTYKKKENGIEIMRFCNKKGYNVIGGFTKLLKAVENSFKPEFVLSFVDLRYGNGSSLVKAGFEMVGVTLGWKWTDFKSTYNRLSCRANMDNRRLSEREHAKELEWYKIYDAGQAKFIKRINF